MRQKLAGHRKAPPAGLWDGICEQMGLEPDLTLRPESVRKPIVLRRWALAAAAAVLALAGFFVFYDSDSDDSLPQDGAVALQTSPSLSQETHPTGETPQEGVIGKTSQEEAIEKTPQEVVPLMTVSHAADHGSDKAADDKSATVPSATVPASHDNQVAQHISSESGSLEIEQEENRQLAEKTDDQSGQKSESEQISGHQPKWQESEVLLPGDDGIRVARQSSVEASTKWSIGVNASGGLLAAQTNSSRTGRVYLDYNGPGEMTNSGDVQGSYTLTDYVSKHHLPVRFGVSMDYKLSPRLTLLSGVSYTYLYSQFSLSLYPESVTDQKLHYLGIPLGLAWRFWSSHRFQLYVSGGATVEKCLNDSPWQWSVHASAGAEYVISPQFGIYAEPSLGYYFDDGTSLEHYYKKHPLAPSLEFGLRLHLNR